VTPTLHGRRHSKLPKCLPHNCKMRDLSIGDIHRIIAVRRSAAGEQPNTQYEAQFRCRCIPYALGILDWSKPRLYRCLLAPNCLVRASRPGHCAGVRILASSPPGGGIRMAREIHQLRTGRNSISQRSRSRRRASCRRLGFYFDKDIDQSSLGLCEGLSFRSRIRNHRWSSIRICSHRLTDERHR